MSSLFDLYLRNKIIDSCEAYFEQYLIDEGMEHEGLTDDDRESVGVQIDHMLALIEKIYTKHEDEDVAIEEIIDKLMGMFVVAKMNEARLCRVLNEAIDRIHELEGKDK